MTLRQARFLASLVLIASALTAATLAGTGPAAADPVAGPDYVPAGYQLAWADEFSGTSVDSSRWSFRTDTKSLSVQRPENVTVGDGMMTIHLCPKGRFGRNCALSGDTGDFYTGGGLISKRNFRYGYYETRAKTNVGSGWHSAFWAAGSADGPRTEIDGFEVDSHAPTMIRHNVIPWTQGYLSKEPYEVGFDTSAAFHTYGFEWREDSVTFYVDGQYAWHTDYSPDTYTHNFLNVWLTAIALKINDQDLVDTSALPGKVQFEYFRFYERDAYADNDAPAGYTEIGTGWLTSSLRGFAGMTARYSCDSGTAGRWTLTPPATGSYAADFYRVGGTGGQADALVTVWDGSTALARTRVDLTVSGSEWVPLRNLALVGGRTYIVRIDKDGPGCIRADAIKFVRL